MNESALTRARIMSFVASAKPAEAKKFYAGTLGLEFLGEQEYSLVFSVNEALTLRVQKVRELSPQPFTVFGWQIEDRDKTVTRLAERGVTFEAFGFPAQDARRLQ